jgi:hypothetical protein
MLTENTAHFHRVTHAAERPEPQAVVSCALCTRQILWLTRLTNCCEFHLYYDI